MFVCMHMTLMAATLTRTHNNSCRRHNTSYIQPCKYTYVLYVRTTVQENLSYKRKDISANEYVIKAQNDKRIE